MKKIVIVDFSHLSMRNLFIAINQTKPRKKDGLYITKEYIQQYKHMIFNSLQYIKGMFRDSEILLALDGQANWRKDFYPLYKANRVKIKEKNEINFDEFFIENDKIIEVIKKSFPFKTLKVNEAEADDIAGVISIKYGKETDIILVTSDHDWMQVQAHNNVKVYDPIKREYKNLTEWENYIIDTDYGPMSRFTLIHSLIGDKGDNVPNVLAETKFSPEFLGFLRNNGIKTSDVEAVKKLSAYPELIEKYDIFDKWKSGKNKGLDKDTKNIFKTVPFGIKKAEKIVESLETLNEFLNTDKVYKDNFKRNKTLVDFTEVPDKVYDDIIEEHKASKINYDTDGMLKYFMDENLIQHSSNINKFYTSKYSDNKSSSLDDFF